jgi:hypothetical protein
LKAAYHKIDPAVRSLEEENERLKRIIAKQAIELEFKTELLKKAMPIIRKQGSNGAVQSKSDGSGTVQVG